MTMKKDEPARGKAYAWPPPSPSTPILSVRLANQTRMAHLDLNLEWATTPLSRMRGLMFRRTCAPLFFTFDWNDRHSIHSFFVSFPFDAIYLDERGVVTDCFACVRPFTPLLTPRLPSRYLLELDAGAGARLKIHIGDSIAILRRP